MPDAGGKTAAPDGKTGGVLDRLRGFYHALVNECRSIYESWVTMMHARIEFMGKKLAMAWKVLSG